MLRNHISKAILTTFILLVFALKSFALTGVGYIITLQSDTVYGQVQLSRFDQVTGGLILNGIEDESFYSRVVFEKNGERNFHTYFSEMISGFGFIYKSTSYIYEQVAVNMKSIFQSEKRQYRFMRLLSNGTYETTHAGVRMIQNPGLQSNHDRYLKFNTFLHRLKKGENNQFNAE